MLTPLDIHDKEFKRSFRGYDEDEIDDFLDRVVNDYEKLFRENDDLREKLTRANKDNEEYQKMEHSLRETLLLAQKTADQLVETAQSKSNAIMETTTKECENMRRETDLYVKQQREEVVAKVRAKALAYDQIIRDRVEFLRKLKGSMEAELSVVEKSIAAAPAASALNDEENGDEMNGKQEESGKGAQEV